MLSPQPLANLGGTVRCVLISLTCVWESGYPRLYLRCLPDLPHVGLLGRSWDPLTHHQGLHLTLGSASFAGVFPVQWDDTITTTVAL